jgi:aminopeptidase S
MLFCPAMLNSRPRDPRVCGRMGPASAVVALVSLALVPRLCAQGARSPLATIEAIAVGEGSEGRRRAITSALRAAGLVAEERPFTESDGRSGVNVQVTLPGAGGKTVLVGAHYDRVRVGRGVVDNGASCAVLIEVLARLKADPPRQLNVVAVFFDLEEVGLVGSRAWFRERREAGQAVPDYAINMDIFAYGDTIYATASHPEGSLASGARNAATTSGLGFRVFPRAEYPASDHHTMMDAGVETLGLALVTGGEIDAITMLMRPGGGRGGSPPRVLTLIHSPNDTEAEARPDDIARGRTAVETLVRQLDRALVP